MKSSAHSHGFGGYGFGNISVALSAILYSAPFTYTLDENGNTLATNKGSFDDAKVFSGHGLELGATNELPMPIPYALGTQELTNHDFSNGLTDWGGATRGLLELDVGKAKFTVNTGEASGYFSHSNNNVDGTSRTMQILIDVDLGTAVSVDFRPKGGVDPINITTNGETTIEVTDMSGIQPIITFFGDGAVGYVKIVKIEEITNPNSFLTIVNGDGTVEQIGNSVDGGSSEELVASLLALDDISPVGSNTKEDVGDYIKCSYVDNRYTMNLIIRNILSESLDPDKTYAIILEYYTENRVSSGLRLGGSALTPVLAIDITDTLASYSVVFSPINDFAQIQVDMWFDVSSCDLYLNKTISVKEILPTSTTYDLINQTVLEAMPTTKELTTADLALIEADTSLMTQLALGSTTTGLSLVTADIHHHFAFMEYSGADCIDTKDGVTTATITNYVSTIRSNVDFSPKGNQGVEFERDGAGVPTEWTDDQQNWHGDGYSDTLWNPSLETAFWIEEEIDDVFYQHKYDGTNLTTWTDGVEGTATAHSPENAEYILGKGVYPKVTADSFDSYVQEWFKVIINTYDSYDEIDAYNEWASATQTLLTDGNGSPLTDGNGRYLYT